MTEPTVFKLNLSPHVYPPRTGRVINRGRISSGLRCINIGYALVLLMLVASSALSQDQLRMVQREYNDQVKPLLNKHCVDCHSGETADAGLDLSKFDSIKQLLNARKAWNKVRVRVAAKEMPPEESDPLNDSDHQKLLAWVDQLLNSVDCTDTNPGRITIRRLNRTEYRNTVRDLIGVDYAAADDFPGDDVGYGFDNIADVLSLPPILMEKYLDAAEQITEQAIVDPNASAFSQSISGSDFSKADNGSIIVNLSHLLTQNGTIEKEFDIPESGSFKFTIVAYGDQAGNEPCEMKVLIDNKRQFTRKIRSDEESNPEEVSLELKLKKGKRKIGIEFTNDFFDPRAPEGAKDRNLYVARATLSGPYGRLPDSHRTIIGKPPTNQGDQHVEARRIVNRFTSKAYRRRASKDELDRLMQFYERSRQSGDGYEVAIRNVFQAVLISPHFLYKIEAPTADGQTRFLSDFELATSLSFFLWGTMPDTELFALANSGGLKDYQAYQKEIARMLADPKATSLVENFAAQWLQLRHLEQFVPDPDLFPGVDGQLRSDMATETKMVIAELLKRDASIFELLESDFTFLNSRLAKHYGIEGVAGEDFRRISADETKRFGLMTQASILTLTSNPTRTSPVKRGKWIMENLLGEEPPPPDPAAMQLEDQAELKGTLRQRMEQHRANPNCAVCHKVMDELGFALENYDAVGRWRDKEETNRIDAHGELPDGTVFQGASELQEVIRTKMKKQFVRCLTEKMLIYALGRGLEYYDECAIDKIVMRLEKNDYRFSQLILGVVTSDPFLKRGEVD